MKFDAIFKARQAWNKFSATHPKVPVFVEDVKAKGVCEGTEVAVAIRYPDGTEYKTGIRVRPEDMELFDMLGGLF